MSVRQRLAAWRAASRARKVKRQGEYAARGMAVPYSLERWALALEMIDHLAVHYGHRFPGGPRALWKCLHNRLVTHYGSDLTNVGGRDPVHTLNRIVDDMFGRLIAREREQAMRAMDERERDDAGG